MNVKITNGVHRGNIINGTFEVVKPWQPSASGGYVTVKANIGRIFQSITPRIKVEQANCVLVDDVGNELSEQHIAVINNQGQVVAETDYEQAFLSSETDLEAIARIRHTFTMMDKVADSVARGIIRGLVISGPPGIGKSCGIENRLQLINMAPEGFIGPVLPRFNIVSGSASPIGLYQILWANRHEGSVICFDDSDGIIFEEDCLNLLKAALNSGERRKICWHKESRVLYNSGIPDSFDFDGSVIFLTNINFETTRVGGRIADHLKAIVSRCHYMDLEIGSMRDKLLRIKQIVGDGMLDKFKFTNGEEEIIVDWIIDNCNTLREVSLRMVNKVAELVVAQPEDWQEYAESTCLVREAKFKRLYENKQKSIANVADAVTLAAELVTQ